MITKKKRATRPKLPVFSVKDIVSWGPCYDPTTKAPRGTKGTALTVLQHKDLTPADKLWVVCREEVLSARVLRLFAVAQAKTCRKNVTNKKEFDRILRVCTKFANEKATKEELAAARYAARDAAWCAARDAAWCAARYTAWYAAWYAARDAARDAAWDAARDARYEKAVNMIIRMIKKEYDCRPSKEAA